MSNNKAVGILILKLLCCSFVGIFVVSVPSNAQPKKIPRIGYLSSLSAADEFTELESFKRGLRTLGRVNGHNLIVEYRFAERNFRRLVELAAELVRLKVDLIVTAGPTPTRVAREASSSIPIVMAQDSDPIGNGFVVSLTRPGGNITGLTKLPQVISGKQLALLREIVPKLARVAVLANAINPGDVQAWKETEAAARVVNVLLHHLNLRVPNDVENIFQEGIKQRADALIVLHNPITFSRRAQIADLATDTRIPTIYPATEFVEAGGLMGYGVDVNDLFRRAASYVDKILKGAKAGNLPVGLPTRSNLIINLKTARRIGITFPANLVARADRVIK